MLIEKLRSANRLFEILHDRLKTSEHYDEELFGRLDSFTNQYLEYHQLDIAEAGKHYISFIKSYNKDLRAFAKEGKFPLEIDPDRQGPGRIPYNIILLFSCLFNPHRFRIMQIIDQQVEQADNGLFVGCGPGLEIDLIASKLGSAVAYDLVLDDFLAKQFDAVDFRNYYFDGSEAEKYQTVFLIEILEHLSDPYELLTNCANVMEQGGKIHLTTASNIPQFDHLYNFPVDHTEFDNKVSALGFDISFSEILLHHGMTQDVAAQNKYYIITKT